MNLSTNNFSRTTLTKEFQEFGGEKIRRSVIRYTYESKNDIFDIEIFNPVPTSWGSVKQLFRRNGSQVSIPHPRHNKIVEYLNLVNII